MFWRLASLALVLVIGAGAWYLLSSPEELFSVDGRALGSSLGREAGSGGACEPRPAADRYVCRIAAGGDGASVRYRLSYEGDGCWRARPLGGGRSGSGRVEGCLGLRDFVLPSDIDEEASGGTGSG